MEKWDLFDAERSLTGQTMTRGEPIPPGRYHMVVHILIFNSRGQLLIQRRQPFKKGWSGMWDVSVGGSAVAGDTSRMAAQREVKEEIGLDIDLSGVAPAVSVAFTGGFDDYYLVDMEPDPGKLTLQPEEVAQVRWAETEEVFRMIDEGSFVPYHKAFLEFLFFCHSTGLSGVLTREDGSYARA